MSWLTRITVPKDLAVRLRLWDSYAWHKRAWECFLAAPDVQRDFLTRIDERETQYWLWLLAQRKPARPDWCPEGCFEMREVSPSFLNHTSYGFDLKANPTICQVRKDKETGERVVGANGKRKSGIRKVITNPEELQAWLQRKAISGGFRIIEDSPLDISPVVAAHFRKDEQQQAYHGGVQFRGVLKVLDRKLFTHTYTTGIGSAKGFGFGLLLLAPINQSSYRA